MNSNPKMALFAESLGLRQFLSNLEKLNYPRINKLSQSNIEWIQSLPNIHSLLSHLVVRSMHFAKRICTCLP